MIGVDTFPCSFAQQRLWFLNRLIAGEHVYNVVAAVRFRRTIDEHILQRSIDALVDRHESLRTTFGERDDEPVQAIAEAAPVTVDLHDLSAHGTRALARAVEIAEADSRTPFDLAAGPLVRVALLRLEPSDAVVLVTTHHIVSDAWSVDVFFRELGILYDAFSLGTASPLRPLAIQYADYAVWQRKQMNEGLTDRHIEYWRRRLADVPVLVLPADRPRPRVPTYRGSRALARFSRELTAAIDACARDHGATAFMLALTAFAVVLGRYARQEDVLIGTLTAGRPRTELEGIIGFFVNTLPLRIDLSGSPTFRDVLRRVTDTVLDAHAHADCPFEKLVEVLQPERDTSRNPLVQVTCQMFDPPGAGGAKDPAAELLDVTKGTAKFDLALDLWHDSGELVARIEYSDDLFTRSTIARLLGHLPTLLQSAVAAPDTLIGALPMLTDEERRLVVCTWNDLDRRRVAFRPIHERVASQAERTPNAPAVIHHDSEWTYHQLDRAALHIAIALRARGVGRHSRVGVCLERSFPLVAALLGIWKAGAAYVPLDPAYPAARLRYMAADAALSVILTDGSGGNLPVESPVVDLRRLDLSGTTDRDDAPVALEPDDLAYVLFTSGSTGRPKGVAIEHGNVAALIDWASTAYDTDELFRVLASTSVCFDLSVFELFAPLCTGGAIVLVENALHLPAVAAARAVTLINTVPSAIAELVKTRAIPDSVRTVNLAGEPLAAALVDEVFAASSVDRIHNLYGPTEDTTYSTGAVIRRGDRWTPTIGRPLLWHRAYIVDDALEPVPVGVPGELCVAGAGVARGYWNQPALSAARFMPSPFRAGERLYRTGDIARFRENGDIELVGRQDSQVKLRGYRIEPGEIEAALTRNDGVAEAVVLLRDDEESGPHLAAFVAPKDGVELDPSVIAGDLEQLLPRYMVPASIVTIERLPLTPNGKVDRPALLARASHRAVHRAGRVARTEMECEIARIWSEVLALPEVGVSDTFFELGGHSLLMLRAHTRLREIVPAVTLLDLFKYPTIESLARHFSQPDRDARSSPAAAEMLRAERQRARLSGRVAARHTGENAL